jgi:hypothetical protein
MTGVKLSEKGRVAMEGFSETKPKFPQWRAIRHKNGGRAMMTSYTMQLAGFS